MKKWTIVFSISALVFPLLSFAADLSLEDLRVKNEAVLSEPPLENGVLCVTEGNFPDSVTQGNFPNSVTAGNFPDSVTSGNFPTSGAGGISLEGAEQAAALPSPR